MSDTPNNLSRKNIPSLKPYFLPKVYKEINRAFSSPQPSHATELKASPQRWSTSTQRLTHHDPQSLLQAHPLTHRLERLFAESGRVDEGLCLLRILACNRVVYYLFLPILQRDI